MRQESAMVEKMKKIAGFRPKPAVWTAIAVILLIVLLIPLLRLAEYAVPWYDDYNYGRFARTAMRSGKTLGNALKGVAECVHISWYAWQGTYGSIIFMVLTPAIWGEEFYFWGPVFLILLLTISVCMFVYTLMRTVLEADSNASFGIGIVTATLTLEMMHTAQAGIYWYNGGVHYVGMHSVMLLALAAALRSIYTDKMLNRVVFTVTGVLLAVLTAGGNFVTALQGILFLGTLTVLGIMKRGKRAAGTILMLLAYAAGFAVNVSAPGNARRARSYVGWGMSPVRAVLTSFKEGALHAWKFTGFMTLVVILFALPMILYAVRRSDFHFKMPGLVSAWSFGLYSAGFTPSLYSMGNPGLGRTLNAVKLTWQILLVLNVIYWCGFLCKKQVKPDLGEQMCRWWYYPMLAVCVLLCFHAEKNPEGSFCSYGAWYEIHSGLAYNFYQEYLERVEILKGDEEDVVLTPYHWTPWMICIGDLSEDTKDESNRALADWYNKESVRVEPED